eukprot:6570248-Heterocapsa_arctica.AAC.1
MSDRSENYGKNAYAIAVPEDGPVNPAVYAILDPADPGPPLPNVHGPEWDVWASRLVDLKGVARPPEFTGEDPAWSEWRFRFES